jgi:hypothetical protein
MWESEYFQKHVWPAFELAYPTDAHKVQRLAKAGGDSKGIATPRANFALGIFEEMRRHKKIAVPPPPPPPPPPDPHFGIAPRTYNFAPSNNSDPRFCVHGIPGVEKGDDGRWHDKFSRYDDDGRDVDGGRTRTTQVPGLRQADNSDGMGECQLYDGLTAWPDGSYDR